jgi:hypothetical protein
MPNGKNSRARASSSGTHWLLGFDQIDGRTLDYLGIRLQGKFQAYLNKKARERARLKKFEKEFLYRQVEFPPAEE